MLQGWERRKEEGRGAIVFIKKKFKNFLALILQKVVDHP
jgi:hypothetical protein